MICARKDCLNPVAGRKTYCSRACSAKVRNTRYYRTIKGRKKKRELAQWYFQRHRQELYDKKADRLSGLFREELASRLRAENFAGYDPELVNIVAGKLAPHAMGTVRFWHDYHPRMGMDWHGRLRWEIDWTDGQLKPYWIRGPYYEELQLTAGAISSLSI